MATFIGILAVIAFLASCYFMGNFILKSFNEPLVDRLVSALYGILMWAAIAAIVLICAIIYIGVSDLFMGGHHISRYFI
jgi:hypothetical protein